MEGEHEHSDPVTPVIAPVVSASNELVAPVVDHTEKITRIEERQAQQQEEYMRQMMELEGRLQEATSSQATAIYERIATLEGKIENLATKPEEEVPEAVDLSLPDVEPSPAPPEKVRQGLRHRRKAKRGSK